MYGIIRCHPYGLYGYVLMYSVFRCEHLLPGSNAFSPDADGVPLPGLVASLRPAWCRSPGGRTSSAGRPLDGAAVRARAADSAGRGGDEALGGGGLRGTEGTCGSGAVDQRLGFG